MNAVIFPPSLVPASLTVGTADYSSQPSALLSGQPPLHSGTWSPGFEETENARLSYQLNLQRCNAPSTILTA